MRINKYVAAASGLSRRAADTAIADGRVRINGQYPTTGQTVAATDVITLDNKPLKLPQLQTILFNKPAGYVVSRDGQGNSPIYDLLPPELHMLKPVGRLDKDSSGLLLLTNNGELAQQLTHPSFEKEKTYAITLNKPLQAKDRQAIEQGVQLEDGLSQLTLKQGTTPVQWQVRMHEGRNRQIRRTFAAVGYTVTQLHRTQFGTYSLGSLAPGDYKPV